MRGKLKKDFENENTCLWEGKYILWEEKEIKRRKIFFPSQIILSIHEFGWSSPTISSLISSLHLVLNNNGKE